MQKMLISPWVILFICAYLIVLRLLHIFSLLIQYLSIHIVLLWYHLYLQLTTHQELWTFIVTNLASVYIREGNRHQEVSRNRPYGSQYI